MKIYLICCLTIAASAGVFPQTLNILPEKIIYEKYFADARSHQLSLSKNLGNNQWLGNIGAVIPVIDLKYEGHLLQVSAAATVFNTVIKTPGHIQVFTVDYLVDFYFDYEIRPGTPLRFIFGHHSAHFSDDGITELFHSPISYVRDYVGLHLQYKFSSGKIYAGYYYNYHIEPEINKKNDFQLGGDRFFNICRYADFYFAADFKFKQETEFTPLQSYQAGVKIFSGSRRALRTAYGFSTGFDERGQFYNKKEKIHSIGIFLDF